MLVIVSGPPAVGKSRFVAQAREQLGWGGVVPWTTRPRRPGEVDAREYRFVDDVEFGRAREQGQFVEADTAAGHVYGLLGDDLERAREADAPIVMHAMARVALRLRERVRPAAVLVFLDPHDPRVLERRLDARGCFGADREARRAHARDELAHAPLFDLRVPRGEIADLMSVVVRIEALVAERDLRLRA